MSHADPQSFDHRAHVQVAWDAIRRTGLAGAWIEVPAFLRGLAAAAGRPDRYHETVTLGYLLLIADRYVDGEPFDGFCDRNPDLFGAALDRYWTQATLGSDRARQRFVFPDRYPPPA